MIKKKGLVDEFNKFKHYELHHNGKVYHISEDGELLDNFTMMK